MPRNVPAIQLVQPTRSDPTASEAGTASTASFLRYRAMSAAKSEGEPELILTLRGNVTVAFPVSRIKSFSTREKSRRALQERTNDLFAVRVIAPDVIEWTTLGDDFCASEMLPAYLGLV